jgi:hypothetical protein
MSSNDATKHASQRPQVHFTMTAKSMLADNKQAIVETLVKDSGLGKGAMVLIRTTAKKTSNNPTRHFTVQVKCASGKHDLVPDLIARLRKTTGAKFELYTDPDTMPEVTGRGRSVRRPF